VTEELSQLDATALAELVRRREVQATELVEAAIGRIEKANPALNAVVTPMYDLARDAARASTGEGPFAGVPFLLKDLSAAYGGVRQASGSAFLRDYIAPEDTELVARYKRAGFIILGKTNTPEFGLLPTTEPALFGPTRNPWDTTRTPGGSSGGSAAAVAGGMVPVAHGSDGGGSIRIPASCCGLFGLKPSRGRNPRAVAPGGLSVEHVLSRSVRDSAAILDATAGAEPGDPYHAPPPARPFIEEVGADPGRLRIAFTRHAPTGTPIHPDCVAAVEDAAALCASLGHEVEEASPSFDAALVNRNFIMAWEAGAAGEIDGSAALTGRAPAEADFERLTWNLAQQARQYTMETLVSVLGVFEKTTEAFAKFHERYDLWLTPTVAEPPPPLGTFESPPENPRRGLERAEVFVPFTPYLNITGEPAMSVPLSWNKQGLPVGVHFAARFGDEATLFRLASQLETARPWAARRPAS